MTAMRTVGNGHMPPHARVDRSESEYLIELDVSDFTDSELTVGTLGPVVTVLGDQLESEEDDGVPFAFTSDSRSRSVSPTTPSSTTPRRSTSTGRSSCTCRVGRSRRTACGSSVSPRSSIPTRHPAERRKTLEELGSPTVADIPEPIVAEAKEAHPETVMTD